jgi:hypothetical protein
MIINLPKLGPVQFRDDLTEDQFNAQLNALSQKFGIRAIGYQKYCREYHENIL